ALVLAAKSGEKAFSDLPDEAFGDFALIVREIERGLRAFCAYDRINYLMLMMVDPHVHFHILPRYAEPRLFEDLSFADPGWPGLPDLKFANNVSEETRARLLHAVQRCWPKT
ncbi:MAG: HIT family protein, partial [Aestuariivirga sp.]